MIMYEYGASVVCTSLNPKVWLICVTVQLNSKWRRRLLHIHFEPSWLKLKVLQPFLFLLNELWNTIICSHWKAVENVLCVSLCVMWREGGWVCGMCGDEGNKRHLWKVWVPAEGMWLTIVSNIITKWPLLLNHRGYISSLQVILDDILLL